MSVLSAHDDPAKARGASTRLAKRRVLERIFAAPSGGADYRVRMILPEQGPPSEGHALMLMLDGQAIEPVLLAPPGCGVHDALVVVLVSHVAQGDAAKAARVYDYTPSLPGQPRPADPRVPQWPNGGADGLLAWIDGTLLPWVYATQPIDRRRMTFYGHSYGGLCVLHALARHALPCTRYVAVSPSVWWQHGAITHAFEGWTVPSGQSREVLMLVGSREAWHPRPTGPDGSPASRRDGVSTVCAARDLAAHLGACPGVDGSFSVIEDATHHTMLAESIAPACSFAARAPGQDAHASAASRSCLT